MLETNGITVFDDRGVKAVDDVSLQIREGEILAIAGVSGNGQTEIADAIAGLMDLTEGSIFLHGQEITKLSIKERINSGISYIPEDRQRDGLIMDLSLSSNLAIKTFDKKPFAKRGRRKALTSM